MKQLIKTPAFLMLILLCPITGSAQLDSVEDVEKFGFWVDMLKDGANSPGIQSLRWRIKATNTESEMLRRKIQELKLEYRLNADQQQQIEDHMFQNKITGSVEEQMHEIDGRSSDIEADIAAMAAERESLKRRIEFELQAKSEQQLLADKQVDILQDMMKLKHQELQNTKQLVQNGVVSHNEIIKLEKEIKEIELRTIVNSAKTKREAFAADEFQLQLAATEIRIDTLQQQLKHLEAQRKNIAEGRLMLHKLPELQFEQALGLKLIERSRIRLLDLEMEAIRHRAVLQLIEEKLAQADKKAVEEK